MKQTESASALKELVKEKYGQIASAEADGCCGSSCGCGRESTLMADDYTKLQGYIPQADFGLGCGLPTEYARIKAGDTVIDLGSGAGNDAFIARSIVGGDGKVIGIDMTEKMIERARLNAEKLGLNNVEFRLGDIENIPVNSEVADVVVSNCVMNLVPDKEKAFAETYRILKPGGHFSISDIVLQGTLPQTLLRAAEMYVGCVAGAIQKQRYISIVKEAGFTNVHVQKEKTITVPEESLKQYLSDEEIKNLKAERVSILSITLYGEKAKS
jgi:arsenite methyltransferase